MKLYAKSILLLTGTIATLHLTLPAADTPSQPNLLIIHTDEHNFRTLGCYRALLPPEQAFVWGPGVAVEPPNIDWLAQHGALCDRFYAASGASSSQTARSCAVSEGLNLCREAIIRDQERTRAKPRSRLPRSGNLWTTSATNCE